MYAYLLKDITKWIPKYIVDKGYEYYEGGHVEDVEIQDKKCLLSLLEMQGIMKQLSISKIFQKVTVCPYENYCKHMVAVVYDMQGAGESAVKEKLKDLEKKSYLYY